MLICLQHFFGLSVNDIMSGTSVVPEITLSFWIDSFCHLGCESFQENSCKDFLCDRAV